MNTKVMEQAKILLEKGFIPIPVRNQKDKYFDKKGVEKENSAKAPLGYKWQETTKDKAIDNLSIQSKKWMRKTGQPINMGIRTGKDAGIFVVDIDKQNNGIESWEKLTKDIVFKTMKQSTPSGGYHYIFKYDDRMDIFSSTANAIEIDGHKVGIDFRSNGGQIVVAPSSYDGKSYVLDLDTPITTMPEPLYQVLMSNLSKKPLKVGKLQLKIIANQFLNKSQLDTQLIMDIFKESKYYDSAMTLDGVNKDGSIRLVGNSPYHCIICDRSHVKNQNHPFIFENISGIWLFCRTKSVCLKPYEITKTVDQLLWDSLDDMKHSSVAKVLFAQYGQTLTATSTKEWYYFKDHRWHFDDGGYYLLNKFSNELVTLYKRLKMGWSIERALTTPLRRCRSK